LSIGYRLFSGKSTLLETNYPKVKSISFDDTFMENGIGEKVPKTATLDINSNGSIS
jgi:hypothetical protein